MAKLCFKNISISFDLKGLLCVKSSFSCLLFWLAVIFKSVQALLVLWTEGYGNRERFWPVPVLSLLAVSFQFILVIMSGKGNCINHRESCCNLYSPEAVCKFKLGGFWHCIWLPFFMCSVSIPFPCGWHTIHVKADPSYSAIEVFFFNRECCKAETSPCLPAGSMAAAGQSNYSVGSPLGITQSVSKRPEVTDSCLPWAPGSQSPCRIKITWPVQHLLASDTCKITLLRAGNNRLIANYSKCWLQRSGGRGTYAYFL